MIGEEILAAQVEDMLMGRMGEEDILVTFHGWSHLDFQASHIAAAARVMREVMSSVDLPGSPIDTCGTGGSGKRTINTSTLVAFLVAAAGGKVAKHGNRSASGNCGSFDLLEALGAGIDLTPVQEQKVYAELGIVFLNARMHHPAMRFVAAARKAFGRPTIFNLLGPLCNPAEVRRQMIGTGQREKALLIAGALASLGTERSLVVTGSDGLDEVTACDTTTVISVPDGGETLFNPAELDLDLEIAEDIEGGGVEENLRVFGDLSRGEGTVAHRNLVLVNAAHAFLLAEIAGSLAEAFRIAHEVLASGRVALLIDRYRTCSRDLP